MDKNEQVNAIRKFYTNELGCYRASDFADLPKSAFPESAKAAFIAALATYEAMVTEFAAREDLTDYEREMDATPMQRKIAIAQGVLAAWPK